MQFRKVVLLACGKETARTEIVVPYKFLALHLDFLLHMETVKIYFPQELITAICVRQHNPTNE